MQLFRREYGESFADRKPRLRPEHRQRAGAGAVALGPALSQNQPQKIKILNHARAM